AFTTGRRPPRQITRHMGDQDGRSPCWTAGTAPNTKSRLMVLRQGMRPVLVALVFGVLGAALMSRLLSSFLFGVSGRDRLTIGFVAIVLFGVGVMACWAPTRRASCVDLMTALRYE